jgi:ABC-type branched-subunit amino acid transport system substrate-binding protein
VDDHVDALAHEAVEGGERQAARRVGELADEPQPGQRLARRAEVDQHRLAVVSLVVPVYNEEGILQISPASTSDEITGLDDPDGLMNRTRRRPLILPVVVEV